MSDKKLTELNMDALDQVAGGTVGGGPNNQMPETSCYGTFTCSDCSYTKTGWFYYDTVNDKTVYTCSECKAKQLAGGGSGGTGERDV